MYKIRKSARGFTLIEVMIVVAIVAILLAVALPGYQQQVLKTKRSLARGELLGVLARQEQYFINNKGYADDLLKLGYPANGYYIDADGNALGTASGSIYQIQFSGTPTTSAYALQAVPNGHQTEDSLCMTLGITSAGVKTENGSGSTADCW